MYRLQNILFLHIILKLIDYGLIIMRFFNIITTLFIYAELNVIFLGLPLHVTIACLFLCTYIDYEEVLLSLVDKLDPVVKIFYATSSCTFLIYRGKTTKTRQTGGLLSVSVSKRGVFEIHFSDTNLNLLIHAARNINTSSHFSLF